MTWGLIQHMHNARVTEKELKCLFDKDFDPTEREKIYKRLKLLIFDYPQIIEKLAITEKAFEEARIKAGKYDKICLTLKIS